MTYSSSEISSAFRSGDDDADNTLSLSEASQAIEKLSGKSIDESTIEAACKACGVTTSREMDGTYLNPYLYIYIFSFGNLGLEYLKGIMVLMDDGLLRK
jgi:hypothetical protein